MSNVVETTAPTQRPLEFPTPGSLMATCLANDRPTKCVVDTGAVITVFKRGHLPGPLKPSNLCLKGALPGTGKLYGPKMVDFHFKNLHFQFPAYESNIDDDCLLGNDFIDYFDIAVESARRTITIRRMSPDDILSNPLQITCSMVHSPSVGKFHAGLVYYVARAETALNLAPLTDTTVYTSLKADKTSSEPKEKESSVHTTQTKSKSKDSLATANMLKVQHLSPEDEKVLKLGFMLRPEVANRHSMHPDVQVKIGIVPCISSALEVQIRNVSDKPVKIPKSTVLAEIYLLDPLQFRSPPAEESPGTQCVHVKAARVKTNPSFDVDCEPIPRLPPLPDTLPPDLEDLLKRCNNLSPAEEEEVHELLRHNHDVFAKDNTTFGCCPWVKFTIDTGDHPPIKMQARPIPLHYRQAVFETFQKYLECGAVRPSQSQWASPILCVRKKTGEVRVCIDYRALNHITKVPAIPIPFTQELVQKLAGHKIYHTFDLAHGYHNLLIHEDDIPKTAIILPEDLGLPTRQLEWTRLSFGLSAAPGIFQQVTDRIMRRAKVPSLQDDVGPNSGVYLDDICIAGDSFRDMINRLQALFNRIRASGFFLKAKKCFIFQEKVEYLGHSLSHVGYGTTDKKVEKIVKWPAPHDVSELRTWLGMITYYSKFLPSMATVATPLYNLLHKEKHWRWSEECERSFSHLKQLLATAPFLGSPDITKGKFILYCDASLTGLGAVLKQEQNGIEVIIAYWSKTLNSAQRNYCVTHRELLALVEAVEHFHHFLAGAPFIVKTDHSALQWLRNFKQPSGLVARWLSRLAAYKFEVQYIKGVDNVEADALSRRPIRPCPTDCKKCTRLEFQEHTINAQNISVFWVTVQPDPDLNPVQLRKDQILDEDLMPIFMAVEEGKRPDFQEIVGYSPKTRSLWLQFKSLVTQHGLLYRRIEHPSGDLSKETFQLILPAKHVKKFVKEHHENPATGNHFGIMKTYNSLRLKFYWPGMFEDIAHIILKCETCARFKFHKRPKVPLRIFQEGVLHGKWHVDICGPINEPSEEGYKYVLVAVEAFSGWPFAIPLKTKESREIAQALIRDVFSVFGSPLALLSDQERCFTSQLLRDICTIYGIKTSNISIAHPAANGKAEKWIRTLKEHIAMMIENDRANWPHTLPLICQAYRNMPHTSTKFSPYQVIFGSHMRSPLDLQRGLPPDANFQEVPIKEYPFWLRNVLEQIHHQVRQNMSDAALRMKNHYDLYSSVAPFKVGELVWFFNRKRIKGKNPKLDTPWEGPYQVTKIVNDCIAAIRQCHSPHKTRIVHLDKLASYHLPLASVQAAWLAFSESPW